MPRVTICKVFRFEAAHQLPNHDGKCARLHGHSYRVEVRAEGEVNPPDGRPDEGMVLDFARLSEVWKPLHDRLDHHCLNDVLPFPTTAENIAVWLMELFHDAVPLVTAVRVWETSSAWAEAT